MNGNNKETTQKEIEELLTRFPLYRVHTHRCTCGASYDDFDYAYDKAAEMLVKNGYANIKKFAEQLIQLLRNEDEKSEQLGLENNYEDLGVYAIIENLLKEFLTDENH